MKLYKIEQNQSLKILQNLKEFLRTHITAGEEEVLDDVLNGIFNKTSG